MSSRPVSVSLSVSVPHSSPLAAFTQFPKLRASESSQQIPHLPLIRKNVLVGTRFENGQKACNAITVVKQRLSNTGSSQRTGGTAVWFEFPTTTGIRGSTQYNYYDCERHQIRTFAHQVTSSGCTRLIRADDQDQFIRKALLAQDPVETALLKAAIGDVGTTDPWMKRLWSFFEASVNRLEEAGIFTNNGTKLTAIGDLHGDFEATVRVLENSDVILVDATKHNRNLAHIVTQGIDLTAYVWDYGNNMVIQTGDLFDRGLHSKEIIDLFIYLADSAKKMNGRVINLVGNHELLQFQEGMASLDRYGIRADSLSTGASGENDWKQNRWNNLNPTTGKYGKWLKTLPLVAYETKSKSIFSHACLTTTWAKKGVVDVNKTFGQMWNDITSPPPTWSWVSAMSNKENPINAVDNGRDAGAISLRDGPVWSRFYNNCVQQNQKIRLKKTLKETQNALASNNTPIDRLVCAHTIVSKEPDPTKVCSFVPEQHPKGQTPSVWFIDVMMTEGYGKGKRWGAIEIVTPTNGQTSNVVIKSPC